MINQAANLQSSCTQPSMMFDDVRAFITVTFSGIYVGLAGVAYMFYYLAKCGLFPSEKEKFLETANFYINVSLDYCTKRHQKLVQEYVNHFYY